MIACLSAFPVRARLTGTPSRQESTESGQFDYTHLEHLLSWLILPRSPSRST